MSLNEIKSALEQSGLFEDSGAYVLVDGQYGSTGKGLVASALAEMFHDKVEAVTTNAGPNSGHTSYPMDEKVVLRQLPTFSVTALKYGDIISTHLNAGAIIDLDVLRDEWKKYPVDLTIHRNAAIVTQKSIDAEAILKDTVGSTGKGTGAALAAKVLRDPAAVAQHFLDLPTYADGLGWACQDNRVFVEVAQGYSLGIDAGFYPYCTSRNCTVGAALSDAGIHPSYLRQTLMVVRTYPIRVGGNSGPRYEDQEELQWEDLGVPPERTTVTNKVRRLFSWSDIQFMEAVDANRPDYIFLNFVNYLQPEKVTAFVENMEFHYRQTMGGRSPKAIILGYGPLNHQLRLWNP